MMHKIGDPRRVIAKVEWHPGDLFPRVGFVVTNMPMKPDWIISFYNRLSTAFHRFEVPARSTPLHYEAQPLPEGLQKHIASLSSGRIARLLRQVRKFPTPIAKSNFEVSSF